MAVAEEKKKIFDNRYEIISIVGRGACSVVYHARHIKGNKSEVALKVLINKKGEAPNGEKLRKEALAMVSSRHKYVIRLDDFHAIGDLAYLSMEYAPNRDVRKYMENIGGKLKPAQAELFLLQTAEALGFVHQVGIIHRDIKPDNILAVNDKEIRLGDFGVAVLPGEESSLEELQKGVGTMSYMAPEVLNGVRYDERSDIYALGVTYYEILTGIHPFDTLPMAEQMERRQDGNIPTPTSLVPEIPEYLSSAIMQALNPDPAARFPSTRELIQTLLVNRTQPEAAKTEKPAAKQEVPKPQQPKPQVPAAKQPKQPVPTAQQPKPAAKPEAKQSAALSAITQAAKGPAAPKKPQQPEAKTPAPEQPTPQAQSQYAKPGRISGSANYQGTQPKIPEEQPQAAATKEPAAKAEIPKKPQPQVKPQQKVEPKKVSDAPEIKPTPEQPSGLRPKTRIDASTQVQPTPKPQPSVAPRSTAQPKPETIQPKPVPAANEDQAKESLASAALKKDENLLRAEGVEERLQKKLKEKRKAAAAPKARSALLKPRPGADRKKSLIMAASIAVFLLLVLPVISQEINGLYKALLPKKLTSAIFGGSDGDTNAGSLIPVFTGEEFAFPFLQPGLYQGSISGIAPGKPKPLLFMALEDHETIVVLVGIEGWSPATVSLEELYAKPSHEDYGTLMRIASNGMVLDFAGQTSGVELSGEFRNIITGETGTWQAVAIE